MKLRSVIREMCRFCSMDSVGYNSPVPVWLSFGVGIRSVAKGGPGGAKAPPSVAKVGPGPPTFLRLCPYFAFDTRLAESAVARFSDIDEDGYVSAPFKQYQCML